MPAAPLKAAKGRGRSTPRGAQSTGSMMSSFGSAEWDPPDTFRGAETDDPPTITVARGGVSRSPAPTSSRVSNQPVSSARLRVPAALAAARGASPSYRGGSGKPRQRASATGDLLAETRAAASQRWPGFPLSELKSAGYNAVQLRAVGHSPSDLRLAGFLPGELKAAGFTAYELKLAKFRASELKAVGFHAVALREAKFRAVELKNAGFSVSELKELDTSAVEMKAAGYSAAELKAAKYRAAELRDAGFTATQLRKAHFKAADLKEAGYPATGAISVGYTFAELKAGGYAASELLRAAGYSASELKTLRYSLKDLVQGGFAGTELMAIGHDLDELRECGYLPTEDDMQSQVDKLRVHASLSCVRMVEGPPSPLSFLRMQSKITRVLLRLEVRSWGAVAASPLVAEGEADLGPPDVVELEG